MQTPQADYFAAYRNLKLSRDDKGVLVAEFHSDGGQFIMTAQSHTEFVDAFHRIGQDRANKIVIITGAGGNFIGDVEWPSFGDVADPGVWSRIHDEGVQVLENIANIRVPVIAAVEGRAHIHSDYALLANVRQDQGLARLFRHEPVQQPDGIRLDIDRAVQSYPRARHRGRGMPPSDLDPTPVSYQPAGSLT